jgi:OOP family OmpA-OmpF porin
MARCFCLPRALVAVTAAVGALSTFEAVAKAEPLIERFDPAERGSHFFVADSLELDGSLRVTTGVVTSYGNRLRTFRLAGGRAEPPALIEHSLWIHPGASLVLSPGVRFGLDVPVALQSGTSITADRTLYPEPGSPRLGDVRGSFDVRLAGRERADVDGAVLAAGVSAYLPTGSGDDYAGDNFARFSLRVATSVKGGPVLFAARAGYMYRRADLAPIAGVQPGSEVNGVLAVGYQAGPLVIGPEIYGSTILDDAFRKSSTPIEALAGAHLQLGAFQLGAGLGTKVVDGLGAPRVRGVLSIEWTPIADVARDRDHDGVMDADDMCPDVPGAANGPLGSRGCPEAPRDGDGDGIIDVEDACPDLRGIVTHQPMTHGCPDADHDGIPDPLDACPTVAGERSVLPRYHGCPPDSDGDGVPDERDACPEESGVASDDPDKNGCAPPPPPPPARDGDGIVDASDACPDAAGPASSIPEANGCTLTRPDDTTTLPLTFDAGGGALALTAEADHAVAKQAAALIAFPVDRLVALGVAKERFDARPAAKAAQRKNQIELRIAP